MERTIDVTTARRQFGTLLDEVFYKGDIITIERKGKPLAQIVPCEERTTHHDRESHLSSEQEELLETLHNLPSIPIETDPTTLLRNIRQQKRIQAQMNYGK